MSIIRQRQRKLIIAFFMGALISTIGFVIFMTLTQLNIQEFVTQLMSSQKDEVLYSEHYVAYQAIEAGQVIGRGDVALIAYEATLAPQFTPMTIEKIVGQRARIDIPAQMPIAASFISHDQGIKDDERFVQCEDLILAMDVEEGQYVDVRIAFPTGLNYTILSMKKIERVERDELKSQTPIWLRLDEQEQMKLSSAYVDMKFYEGTYIYTTRYVDEALQEPTLPNYPVNLNVLSLIRLKYPILALEEIDNMTRLRQGLDDSLVLFAKEETLSTTSKLFGETDIVLVNEKEEIVVEEAVSTEEEAVSTEQEAVSIEQESIDEVVEPVVSGF